MKKFPDMTRDRIEQLYASTILPQCPYYGEFWEKFIGFRLANRLLPYELKMPPTLINKAEVLGHHEEISMRHYSQFCQLAGAHFQLEQAREALNETDEARRHFLFWEAFENFYQHLGNARNEMYGLWNVVWELDRSLPKRFQDFLSSKNQGSLSQRICAWEQKAIALRDNIVHLYRVCAPWGNGTYWIPLPIGQKVPWSETLGQRPPVKEATRKMAIDLCELESLLNEAQHFIGDELDKMFKVKGVEVCYEQ